MTARSLRARLDRLGSPPPAGPAGPYCVNHRFACEMGMRPLRDPELVRMVNAGRERLGLPTVPLLEHRAASAKEQRLLEKEFAALLAETKARVAAEEAVLRGDGPLYLSSMDDVSTLEDWS